MLGDTFQESIAQIVQGVQRRSQALDYRASYMGTIVASTGNLCDVEMDDNNLFPQRLTNCRLLRPDGFTSLNPNGTRCYVFWSAHNPSLRYAEMAFDGNGTVNQLEIKAAEKITFFTPETIADKDLISEHEIGKSAGALSASPGINTTATVSGDDTAFDVTIKPADNTKPMGSPLATVTFGRAYDTAPKAVLSFQSVKVQPTPSNLSYSTTGSKIDINGTLDSKTNPDETVITVFIRGNKP